MTTDSPGEIDGIAIWLAAYSGISTSIIGVHSLTRAIRQRLKATGIEGIVAYQDLLLASPEEQQNLVELVVVPETWFFRDRHPYTYLREHVDGLLQGELPSKPLRLLSAPCSTGEEPYSMAMTLIDMGLPSQAFSIDAIDICRQSIRKARQAVYGKHSFRGVSEEEKQLHFQASAKGHTLHAAIRQTVVFRRSNLMHCLPELATRYDVIFCRNLLIYLEESASQLLLETFAGLLKVGGLLVVGSAETGKVPGTLYSPIRAPYVFGFLRREPQGVSPPPAGAISSRDANIPERRQSNVRQPRRSPLRPQRSSEPTTSQRLPRPSRSAPRSTDPRDTTAGALAREDQSFAEELELDPYSHGAYLRYGQWLASQDRAEEAIDCLQKCLYLKPDSRDALEAMIQLTTKIGQLKRSRLYQGRLERLDP